MPLKPKVETNIPLHCTLCPKNPKFSDVSHLLTHISSKSHLANRFKLQIRAQTEIAAQQQLDNFDRWYTGNGLDVMLSERMASKEHKKSAKEKKARISNEVKKEKQEIPIEPTLAGTPVYRAPIPRMHLWPTANTSTSTPTSEWEAPAYATPSARRSIPNFSQETPTGNPIDPNLTTPQNPDNEKSEGKLTDSIKLKGVQWPGMDLFDSATPEMKRMRNQRKDSSVLNQMMATSAGVTPFEHVYFPDGALHHTRDIFGPLSCENSPEKQATPKKRKPRKATLGDVSVNVPRIRAPRAKKGFSAASPQKRPSAPLQNRGQANGLYDPPPILNPLAAFGRRFAPSTDEEEEFRMTVADMGKKRHFSIFQDAPEISPGRTESPLPDARFDFTPSMDSSSTTRPTNHISPTPVAKPGMRIFGKENGQPEMISSQVQIRQTVSTSQVFAPPLYDYPNFNPLYNPYGHGRPANYGGYSGYAGLQPGFQGSPSGPASTFHGTFRPLNASPNMQGLGSGSAQQSYATRHSNAHNGSSSGTNNGTGNSSGGIFLGI